MGEPERIFNTLNSISDLQTFIDNEPESLYVDFKEVANPTNPMKQNDDKENFAKALSGFANSNGGVLIWGVREEKNSNGEIARRGIKTFKGVGKFIETLNDRAGKWVDPSVDDYDAKPIWQDKSEDNGAVKVIIPKSDKTPHLNLEDHRFWCRSGSNFQKMELYQIDDMFGRRPKPKLEVYCELSASNNEIHIKVSISNTGSVSAKNVACRVVPKYGSINYEFQKIIPSMEKPGITFIFPDSQTIIHPGMKLSIAGFTYLGNRLFTTLDLLDFITYCENMPPFKTRKFLMLAHDFDIFQNFVEPPCIIDFEKMKNYLNNKWIEDNKNFWDKPIED
jgi:hypothetical protein